MYLPTTDSRMSTSRQTRDAFTQLLKTKNTEDTFEISQFIDPLQKSYNIQRVANCASPLYRGHFVNFHQERLNLENNEMISGVEDGFAYFAYENIIRFYFFSPLTQDLNYYYNIQKPKYVFPIREKEKELMKLDSINAIGFQNKKDRWLMAVAGPFEILLFQFVGDLEEFQDLGLRINCNGEQLTMIQFYKSSLIYGGSAGQLQRRFIDQMERIQMKLTKRVVRTFKKVIQDFSLIRRSKGISQIEIDSKRKLVYGLVEQYQANSNIVQKTSIVIYHLDSFDLLQTITQDSLLKLSVLKMRKEIELTDLQIFNIQVLPGELKQARLVLTTKQCLQLVIQIEMVQQQEEISEYALSDTYDVNDIVYPHVEMIKDVPYGICVDDCRINLKSFQAFSLQYKERVKSILSKNDLRLIHKDNQIIAQFTDLAHLAYQQSINDNIIQRNEATLIFSNSLYRDVGTDAYENIPLNGIEFDQNKLYTFSIGEYNVKNIFKDQSIDSFYNTPSHFICVGDYMLEFLIQMRPVDHFFMALKATHIDFISSNDCDLPVERLVQAYGIEESCCLMLQIMIQKDQSFFVNVKLEEEFQKQLDCTLKRLHHSEYVQRFFEQCETTPDWVTGEVYVLPGEIVFEKARKAYFYLSGRTLFQEQKAKSKKVQSTAKLIYKMIHPLFEKPFLNKAAYDLETNETLDNYSLEQLRVIENNFLSLINLFEQDDKFYVHKNVQIDTIEPIQLTKIYTNGFSMSAYQESTRLSISNNNNNIFNKEMLINVNSDQENGQMKHFYIFSQQILQLVRFLIYFFSELENVRAIINAFSDKAALFKNLCLQQILFGDKSGSLTLKQLMIQIIKSESNQVEHTAKYLQTNFYHFFSIQDCRVSEAEFLLDQLILHCASNGIIKIEIAMGVALKLKRFLKLVKDCPLSIEKILSQNIVYLHYKELQADLKEKLLRAFSLIEEVVPKITYYYLSQTFKPYMYPFATFPQYIKFLLIKINQLSQQSAEYKDCLNHLVEEINYLIIKCKEQMYKDLLTESLRVVSQYQIEQVHTLIYTTLFQNNLLDMILILNTPFDIPFNMDLTQQLIQHKQLINKYMEQDNDYQLCEKVVALSVQIAKISLTQNAEMSYNAIMSKLTLKQRLEFLNKASDLIAINNKKLSGVNLSEYEKEIEQLDIIISLQQIMLEFVESQEIKENQYIEEKRKILLELLPISKIYNFFKSNQVYFAQILAYDAIQRLHEEMPIVDLSELYADWVVSHSLEDHQLWPTQELKQQLDILLKRLQLHHIYIEQIIQDQEILNYHQQIKYQEVQIDSWLIQLLLQHSNRLNITSLNILEIYFALFNESESIQNCTLLNKYDDLQDINVVGYKIQLAQTITILLKYTKKHQIPLDFNIKAGIQNFYQQFLKCHEELLENYNDKFTHSYVVGIKELVEQAVKGK